MPLRIVDGLEVVDVEDGQGHRPAVAHRGRPLALDLLLERAVVPEARQGVAQRFGASPLVGVLEDAMRFGEPLGGLQHSMRQPDGQRAEKRREQDDAEGRDDQGGAATPGQPIDHRRRDPDGDGEHRDERQEQAQAHEPQVRGIAEDALLIGGMDVDDRLLVRVLLRESRS